MLKSKLNFLSYFKRNIVFLNTHRLCSYAVLKDAKIGRYHRDKNAVWHYIKLRSQENFDNLQKPNIDQYKELIIDEDSRWNVKNILDNYYELRSKSERFFHEHISREHLKSHKWPCQISVGDMRDMMEIESQAELQSYFRLLFAREMNKWAMEIVKDKERQEKMKKKQEVFNYFKDLGMKENDFLLTETGNLVYKVKHNCLTDHILQKHLHKLYWNNLKNATLYGDKLVIDLSYDSVMPECEAVSLARQLWRIYVFNRKSSQGFDLHFCNCDFNSNSMKHFFKFSNNIHLKRDSLINLHKESFIDLFPRDRLVYFSPHSDKVMTECQADHIYVLGGFVGKRHTTPVSTQKAKYYGIQTVRLPINELIHWKTGSKCLPITYMVYILSHLKQHGDWKKAFSRGLPEFRIKDDDDIAKVYAQRLVNMVERKF